MDKQLIRSRYRSQKASSIKRNIGWNFTFETWLEWWGDDFINRGRERDQLCMARHEDIGPYDINNVKKLTNAQNAGDAHRGKTQSVEWRIKRGQARKAAWDRLKEMQ
jgi:hypothetical protein